MATHIPFVYSIDDCKLVGRLYADAAMFRVSLETADKVIPHLPSGAAIWLDPAIDGLHREWAHTNSQWKLHIRRFPGYEKMRDPAFQVRPDKDIVARFVSSILDQCHTAGSGPEWLSVPQVPIVTDASRNKMIRQLAESAGNWKVTRKYRGKLILPVIFTSQQQLNRKRERDSKIALVQSCFQLADADGVWVVDSTLNDQSGMSTLHSMRFPALIKFHQELDNKLPKDMISIAGPYWGVNLLLWVRSLITYPAIGVGKLYQYHISGGKLKRGKTRVVVSPLRRLVFATPQFANWLDTVLQDMPKEDRAHSSLSRLARDYDQLRLNSDAARALTAKVYKRWFDAIEATPAVGRALAMYQDLSRAYVLGKSLPNLPGDEGPARRPERVAEQLMLNCL